MGGRTSILHEEAGEQGKRTTDLTQFLAIGSLDVISRGITSASFNGVFVALQAGNQADNLLVSAIPEPSAYAAIFVFWPSWEVLAPAQNVPMTA
jgi:hypothetical protein